MFIYAPVVGDVDTSRTGRLMSSTRKGLACIIVHAANGFEASASYPLTFDARLVRSSGKQRQAENGDQLSS